MTRVAILCSVESFEDFFRDQLGLSPNDYVSRYRNDWAWDYCRILRDQGIEASLYLPSLQLAGRRQAPDGFAVRFVRLGDSYRPWVRFPILKRSPLGRFAAQGVGALSLLEALRAGLRQDGADVLLVQEYWTARFDVLAMRLRLPVIGVDQGMPDRHEIKLLKRWTLPRARALITQTETESAKARRYKGRPVQIPNGVDTEFFRPGPPAEEREPALVLTAARLHDPQKRISDLLRAISVLGSPWRLEVLGSGPHEDRLRRLASGLGVAERVEFAGFLGDKAEVRQRLQRCSVFALPSAFEGLPVALLEAMSCGAPSVGSDIPAIAEVIEDGMNGLLVPVGDPQRLARAIARASTDRERLSIAARTSVLQRFSNERIGPELAALVRAAATDAVPRQPSAE